MTESSGGESTAMVPKELASLVPSFDPAVDSVEIWTSKVELLLSTWPSGKINELATRLILGCKGTAYQKLQLARDEILTNSEAGIRRLVELVGGAWGQIPLEKKFELAEKALFRSNQKPDESSDSYLQRCDVVWTELLSKKVTLPQLQAYVVLRNSRLNSEDKKRVIVESKNNKEGELKMTEVTSAIRLLGSGFFQDYTGAKREKVYKTYDHTAFHLEEELDGENGEHETYFISEDPLDDDLLETLAAEDDEDALMVMQFEDSIAETIQNDADLSAFYSTYQDARRRLSERARVRGFWPVQKKGDKGKGKGKKGKGKGKSRSFGQVPLARRIANSYCRICLQKGHWKDECPQRGNNQGQGPGASQASTAPTSFVITEEVPPELSTFTMIDESQDRKTSHPVTCVESCYTCIPYQNTKSKYTHMPWVNRFRTNLKHNLRTKGSFEKPVSRTHGKSTKATHVPMPVPSDFNPTRNQGTCDVNFATTGAIGIADLGASQTVIGSEQVRDLISNLPEHVRRALKRTSCNLVFRFGNQQTLNSRHALLLPLGDAYFRIAIVPGRTPFLLSSSFLKGIKAVIDTDLCTIYSKVLQRSLTVEQSNKNLYLLDIRQLWDHDISQEQQVQQAFHTSLTPISEDDQKEPAVVAERSQSCESHRVEFNKTTCVSESSAKLSNAAAENSPSPLDSTPCGSNQTVAVNHAHSVPEVARVPQEPEARSECSRPPEDQSHDARGAFEGSDSLRQSQDRPIVQSGLRGPSMDGLVCVNIRAESLTGTSEVRPVCREEAECRSQGISQDCQGISHHQAPKPELGAAQRSSELSHVATIGVGRDFTAGSVRSHQDAKHGGTDDAPSDGEPKHCPPSEHDGDGAARSPAPCESHEHQDRGTIEHAAMEATAVGLDVDYDFETSAHPNHYQSKITKLVHQITKELNIVQQHHQDNHHARKPRLDLLEVMCSDRSELTGQVLKLGGRAKRFGRVQGDLSTSEGRKRLFSLMINEQPKHLWYSPVCGPWGQWSYFNLQRSITCHENIMQQRIDQLWQIALGIVLFRFQVESKNHFDMEQPRGSSMWKVPGLHEIIMNTFWNEFDLCQVGNLRDPNTGEFVRKRLGVYSTSIDFHVALHGRLCSGQHVHKPIAGSIKFQGQSMSMSKWTENYPQKFARQVAKIILQDSPLQQKALANQAEHPTKRRRLTDKLSPQAIEARFSQSNPGANWQTVMRKVDQVAPRVGTHIVDSGELLEMIHQLCPEHEVRHLVLCRGTDRYVGPNKAILPGIAPVRRRVCLVRKTNALQVDDEWEPWEKLSQRQLRKKGVPARVSMTIFAAVRSVTAVPSQPEPKEASADTSNTRTREASDDSQQPEPKRHCPESNLPKDVNSEIIPNPTSELIPEEHPKQIIDLASQKHGPLFQQLSSEEQNWLLKLHRNLGHPGTAKLTEFCRQLQCPEHISKAIGDLRCSTCQETKGPVISRPSAIHEPCDFGDIVSMDGITWTNSNGEQYHFYHFIDQSTLFHTAVISPSHTSESACRALLTGWFNWAGPPGLLCVDAGTELNADEFGQFLQRHGVKCRTCATDAHWQNSRVERHGGILQLILNKIDAEQPIRSYDQLAVALSHATSTKNQWSRHRGYPPELLVFGKGVRVPGSITSDPTVSAHSAALSNLPEGARFRQDLAIRESARRAFASVDNDQTLRRAIVHRSRPQRGIYQKGDWVMMWKKRGEADGQWFGPMQVIIQESQSVIWVTKQNKLFRVAPEHVRNLSAFEEFQNAPTLQRNNTENQTSIIPTHGGIQYHDTTSSNQPNRSTAVESIPSENHNAPTPAPEEAVARPNPGVNPMTPQVSSPDQPDGEPEIQSTPSLNSRPLIDTSQTENSQLDGVNIPVPNTPEGSTISDDSNLLAEEVSFYAEEVPCYQLQPDQAYRFEVTIDQKDIAHWREEPRPHEMAFLVSAAKKQRSEVKLSNLNSTERKLFEEAKSKEIDSWLSTDTVMKILRHQVPRENIMRCRWILTWKEVEADTTPGKGGHGTQKSQPSHKAKARLVVLGFEDPMVDQIPRDSPTMTKLSRVLILQHAASLGWDIHSFDIKTAFLRGTENSSRILGLEPPEEMRNKMKLQPQEIVRLLKGAYGRVDAPFLWYQELSKTLTSLGFEPAPFDPCLFVLRNSNHGVDGLLGIHVDDGLSCGNQRFHQKIKQLEEKYPFGSKRSREFTFTGLKISQKQDQSIWVSQEQYVKDIHAITIDRSRRQIPESPVTEAERQSLRAVIGSLQYAAVHTRPDLCSRLGWLQSQINRAKISTLIECNKILHEAKMHSNVTIKFNPIPIQDLRFVAFSDASFASEKTPDSHQGMIIMATHKDIGSNKNSPINPIVWHSKKIQKVVVSTLSAEAMALAGAVDILSWIRLFWAWLCDGRCKWQLADETLLQLPPAFAAIPPDPDKITNKPPPSEIKIPEHIKLKHQDIITTDCKSLYDLISRHAPPTCQEFRTQLQVKLIKEHLRNGIMIRWVPSQAQLADALTKMMDATVLRECLAHGRYSLHDEAQILRERSDSRTRLQWIRNLNPTSSGDNQNEEKPRRP